MQFSSAIFLMIFLPITMLLYYIGGKNHRAYKNIILLFASLFFYGWGEPSFIIILMVGIALNYLLGILIENKNEHKKLWLVLSLVLNLGILIIFKYLTFITTNLSYLFGNDIVKIALPIGISFYTFQIMSYIFDVYYGNVKAQHNFLNLALYISMFPQLVAGPIVRYSDIEFEIRERIETKHDFEQGLSRFVIGLAKKVLIADLLGGIADKIFVTVQYESIPMLTAWIGAIAYTFEIYYDFSGYSDMAIGLGKCFGFHFNENFNYPYISTSVTEFWRRWHISLTSWFRDYVYIPLGGNRVSSKRHILNLFVVWLLTGIWHGAEWTFIIWGLIYFGIQLFEKKTGVTEKMPKVLGYLLTMLIVTICWVIFKASNISNAFRYIRNMFSFVNIYDLTSLEYAKSSLMIMIVAYIGSFPIVKKIKNFAIKNNREVIWSAVEMIVVAILLILSLMVIVNGSYSPFIYFNF